jgi:hypothetical protein
VNKLLEAGKLKHRGIIKKVSSYTLSGQPDVWVPDFNLRFGIMKQVVSEPDQEKNTGNKKTLSLFSRYDDRVQDGQTLFVFNTLFTISQLDNVDFANRRLNFTATELEKVTHA